jgi:hypothetical protein
MTNYIETVTDKFKDGSIAYSFTIDTSKLLLFRVFAGKFSHYCTNHTPLEGLHKKTAQDLMHYETILEFFSGMVALESSGACRTYTGSIVDIVAGLVKDYPDIIK